MKSQRLNHHFSPEEIPPYRVQTNGRPHKAFYILYTTMALELDPKLERNIFLWFFQKREFAFPSQLLLAS